MLPRGSPGQAEAQRFLLSRPGVGQAARRVLQGMRETDSAETGLYLDSVGEAQETLLWESCIVHEAPFAFNVSRAYFSQVSGARPCRCPL